MTGASKIPPHIARELRRHVKPKAKASSGASAGKNTNKKPTDNGKLYTFLGCTAFVGVTASFPFFGMAWIGPLSDRDEELTGAQIRRGAFNNSGSRDAGKDPNWDFKTGTRIKNDSYSDLFLKDNPDELDHADKFVYDAKKKGR